MLMTPGLWHMHGIQIMMYSFLLLFTDEMVNSFYSYMGYVSLYAKLIDYTVSDIQWFNPLFKESEICYTLFIYRVWTRW